MFCFEMFVCKAWWVIEIVIRETHLTSRLSTCNSWSASWSMGDQPSAMSIEALIAARDAHWDQFDYHITCNAKKLTYQAEYGHDEEERDLSGIAFLTEYHCEIEWNWKVRRKCIWATVSSRCSLSESAIDNSGAHCRKKSRFDLILSYLILSYLLFWYIDIHRVHEESNRENSRSRFEI
jgi:hypothetical protein